MTAFSLNDFQSSSLKFFGVLVQGETLPFFVVKCSLVLVIPPFVTFL